MPQALMAELARALAWREMQAADGAEIAAR
jgi:hypothetical protein